MVRGSTPIYTVSIPDFDLTDKTVYITIDNGNAQITLSGDRLTVTADETASTVAFSLTQRETLMFSAGQAEIQARFIDNVGMAYVTQKKPIPINDVLYRRVIRYERES